MLRKERPDLIISSGAAVAVPFFLIGKLLGTKLVYVEVFDRVDKPTMTGRMLNGIADLFVVQWPEQLQVYTHAVDLGSIFKEARQMIFVTGGHPRAAVSTAW